jgi:uncharacterized membrane protein
VVLFFSLNGAIAAWTATLQNLEVWALYNGAIAYLLIGAGIVAERLVRRRVRAAAPGRTDHD